jgi:hypothetical protein
MALLTCPDCGKEVSSQAAAVLRLERPANPPCQYPA